MKIEVVKHPVLKKGCDFCDKEISISTPVFGIIRDRGNSLYARICDGCLEELFSFRQKYYENIF